MNMIDELPDCSENPATRITRDPVLEGSLEQKALFSIPIHGGCPSAGLSIIPHSRALSFQSKVETR